MAIPFSFLILFHLSSIFAAADMGLIRRTCQSTKYYDLCVSSLQIDPKSLDSDVPGLATIVTTVAVANATDAYAYLANLTTRTSDASLKWVLRECSNRYRDAGEALDGSLQQLQSQTYDYAYVQVTAARDYPNSCHNVFNQKKQLLYPPALQRREQGLVRLCDVALGIIGLLDFD
ncbi:hypothetical protein H6P81_001754 [Aristolochia fimbriata]|uniref:Pectinesterase inhibitor domain-containing protein n=1 Tax=Aristolochia fimbriata TaxID=158543 RepID=A0AAV7FBM5_ARIFI|nr:hypothetical protein H6P81_001754 [Aristolochia fimbriata]